MGEIIKQRRNLLKVSVIGAFTLDLRLDSRQVEVVDNEFNVTRLT